MAPLDRTIELARLIQSRMAECEALKDKALIEKRHLTGEEMIKFGTFMNDVDTYTGELELEKREASARERLNKPLTDAVRPPVDPHIDDLQAKYPGLPAKEKRFSSFGEQLQMVRRATDPSLGVDPRLYRAVVGLSEGTPSDGGFLLQQDYSADIRTRIYTTGMILPRVSRLPISANSNSTSIPVVKDDTEGSGIFGGIIAYWLSEGGTKTVTLPQWESMTLKLKKLAAVVPTTDELLADAVALEAFVRLGAGKALVKAAELAVIRGTGAGQPLGILNSGALVTVAIETGQLADTIVYENITKMWSRMAAESRPNAIWIINQSIEPQLYTMGITVGVGGSPVYTPAGGASGSPYGSLFGRPVVPCNYCSAIGDVGDIILVDFSEYLWIEKGGVQEASSIHVEFLTDQTYYRFVMRIDGQPAWKTVFTPTYGTTLTQSPFVTLAARP